MIGSDIGCRFAMVASVVLAATAVPAARIENGPCSAALQQSAVCEAANERALQIFRARNLEATTVVMDVRTGSLVAFAASNPARLDITTPLLPLSTVKLMVAASWCDHELENRAELPNARQLLSDAIVRGNDDAGRQMASALRKAIGARAVLEELNRYGFPFSDGSNPEEKDTKFWREITPQWRDRIVPALSFHSLGQGTPTPEWEDTLSIGESHFTVTALHLSRFLQAIGNNGVMLPSIARAEKPNPEKTSGNPEGHRIMRESAARKLQVAMRTVVQEGTAKGVAGVLVGTGWQLGGKTGTGPGPNPPGPNSDGWFAGLIFDPEGNARFTVATFVKRGGYGGSNAARISAELARFLIGADMNKP